MNRRGLLVNETLVRLASGLAATAAPVRGPRAAYFPDFILRTHENKPVRFYTDLIQGKIVVINMIYVQCEGLCPGITANLVKVQRALGERAGRDIFMYSLTLKPDQDSPAALKHYAEMHRTKPGWLFLTGKRAHIEILRRKLGFFDPDPVVDQDKSRHIGLIRFGNEALDRWGREAILVFFLGAHYRSPLDFSDVTMQAARAQSEAFRGAFRVAAARPSELTWESFAAALDDDFDTPRALAVLHGWRAAGQLDLVARGLAVFGLEIDGARDTAPAEAQRLAVERQAARARRDYAEADRLRAEIARLGWEVQDVAGGFRVIPMGR
jgi:protein SCO1/2